MPETQVAARFFRRKLAAASLAVAGLIAFALFMAGFLDLLPLGGISGRGRLVGFFFVAPLFGAAALAAYVLRCPACGKQLPPDLDTFWLAKCSHCGARLRGE